MTDARLQRSIEQLVQEVERLLMDPPRELTFNASKVLHQALALVRSKPPSAGSIETLNTCLVVALLTMVVDPRLRPR